MKKPLIIVFLLLSSIALQAEIYKWTDQNGKVHYSDQAPKTQKAETIQPKVNSIAKPGNHYSDGTTTTAVAKKQKVIMYSTKWCGYCKKASRYFKQNNIPFKEYDIESNKAAKKRYDALGGSGVPLILVGKKRMQGFSVKRFQSIYP